MNANESSLSLSPSPHYRLLMWTADLQCAEFFKTNFMELHRKGSGSSQAASLIRILRRKPKGSIPVNRASAPTPKRLQRVSVGLGLHWDSQLDPGGSKPPLSSGPSFAWQNKEGVGEADFLSVCRDVYGSPFHLEFREL